jgi:zinc protease
MSRWIKFGQIVAVCIVSCTSLSFAGLGAAAQAQHSVASLDLPLERFRLSNGLEVVLHPDAASARVVVNVLYRVGAADESPERTGIAHLFEHLMFMGTQRIPDKQIDLIMERAGGWNNAYTSEDVTVYYDVGPARLLQTLLWIEADRMATLPRALTQRKLALQRDVVLNEYRQSYQNAPYGPAELLLPRLSFVAKTPYSWPVIGDPEQLMRVSVRELRQWFRRYYSPANASLVIGGRFDPVETRAQVERYFGWIPSASLPLRPKQSCRPRSGRTREVIADEVELPKLWLAWPTTAAYAEGDAELDLVAQILATGKQSRLQRALVHERRLAVSVSAYQHSRRLCGQFVVTVTARPGVSRAELEKATEAVLQRLGRRPVEGKELERAQNRLETELIADLQQPQERADLINRYLAYVGRPDYLATDLARYQRATVEGVRRQVQQLLDSQQRVLLWVVPKREQGSQP